MEQNFIIAGFGGQGVLFAGKVLANAFMLLGKNVTWYPCYGAEMRGGTVNCEIVISDEEVSSVHKENADYIIVLNQLSFDRFLPKVKKGGLIFSNSTLVEETKTRNDIKYSSVPMTKIANESGHHKLANMVALGALTSIVPSLTEEVLARAIQKVLEGGKEKFYDSNLEALKLGINSFSLV